MFPTDKLRELREQFSCIEKTWGEGVGTRQLLRALPSQALRDALRRRVNRVALVTVDSQGQPLTDS